MPTWQGVKFRFRLIAGALTEPFSQLVSHPRGQTGVFEFLRPWLADLPQSPRELEQNPANVVPGAAVVESSELEVARTLYTLASLMKAQRIVEVGVYRGFTSAFLAAALVPPRGALHLVDLSEGALQAAAASAKRFEIPVSVSRGYSTDAAVLAQVQAGVDLIYLDADHSEAGVAAELEAWWPKVRRGGVVAIHDAVNIAGVCRAVNRWADRFPCLTVATGRGSGLALLRVEDER